jgi:3-oxoacyl-[acyl-carrier protein] reductase
VTRTAIVTGAHSGMGAATVALLTAQGVAVTGFDVRGADPVDVSDEASVIAGVARARAAHGPIDIVVNAAGIAAGGALGGDEYVAEWDRSIAVNLTGAMYVVRACLDDLLASDAGRVVNVASTEALGAGRGSSQYTVAKHGLLGFTRSLAVDHGRSGLTANCVCPGATLTGMTQGIPEADRTTFARRAIPLGRYGTPEEIAYMIVALCAREASFVNGAVITVDGGMTAVGR